jgi:hypothetical protein
MSLLVVLILLAFAYIAGTPSSSTPSSGSGITLN